MVKITFLGSCRFEPYEILAVPKAHPTLYNTEEGYQIAFEKFKKAMDESDLIICYAPDGVGEHTGRDLEYARSTNAQVIVISKKCRSCSHISIAGTLDDKSLGDYCEVLNLFIDTDAEIDGCQDYDVSINCADLRRDKQ